MFIIEAKPGMKLKFKHGPLAHELYMVIELKSERPLTCDVKLLCLSTLAFESFWLDKRHVIEIA
jgi:hypothetical protein